MNVQFHFKIAGSNISALALANYMRKLAAILLKIHPDYTRWYLAATGPEDAWVPLDSVNKFNAKVNRENPPGSFMMATIMNRSNEDEWYKPGGTTIVFEPLDGNIRLEIFDAELFFGGRLFEVMKEILLAFVVDEQIEWASLDCSAEVPDDRIGSARGGTRSVELSHDYRTFPHGDFLGWMGWIPQPPPQKLLRASDVPQAADVYPLPERNGVIVISVGEAFDMLNPAHIRKMQQVEWRLAVLDLLPVEDPELAG
jgi:hypothetical protein